jgi:DNA-binding beta-propeller fold protein YncE
MQDNYDKIQRKLVVFLVVIIAIVLVLAVTLSNFIHAQEIDKKTLYRLTNQTSATQRANITTGIAVGDGPMAIGIIKDKAYVANSVDGTVSVIDIKKIRS